MNKTWRASDILIAVLIVLLGGLVYVQTEATRRLHERLNRTVDQTEYLSQGQDDVIARLKRVEDCLGKLRAGSVVVDAHDGTRAGADETPGATEAPGEGDIPEQQKYGGTLVLRCPVKLRSLNPITYRDWYAAVVLGSLYDSMIQRNPDTLAWEPAMAESWDISPDGLQYTFTLRENLKWSDGHPLTTADVVFSYETIMDPAVDAARLATYYKDIKKVEALDERRVRFTFSQPYFLAMSFAGGIQIIPKHVYQYEGEAGGIEFSGLREPTVFSGPYVLDQWEQGVAVHLRRNRHHWDKPRYIERVTHRVVEEETAAFQMLKAEQLDHMILTPEHYRQMGDVPELMASYERLRYSAPGRGYYYIGWNNRKPPFDDPRIRRAMTHLVPRERMQTELLHDLVQITTGPFWPGSDMIDIPLQYDTSIEPLEFNPARAVQLLNEAGWRDTDGDGILDKDGREFKFQIIAASHMQERVDICNITAEAMSKVGVKMEVARIEWTVYTKKLDERDFDACILGWGGGGIEADPYQIWHSSSYENKGSNHIGFTNDEADRLIEEARKELDRDRRNELYHEFHRLLHREQPYTFLYSHLWLRALHKRIRGVKLHPLGLDDREWWIAPEDRFRQR